MPITWTVSHEERLVTATLWGDSQSEDGERYLSEINAAGAMSYRKIFDARYSAADFGSADVRAMGKHASEYAKTGPIGPLAIVAESQLATELANIFGKHVQVDRPMGIFPNPVEAREWLDRVAPMKHPA